MRKTNNDCRAVSEVVGEMLMIGIVLILAAVFSSQLPNYLPSDRSPSVTFMMSNDTSGSVTLWHKGGDWIKISSVRLIVSNQTTQSVYTYTGERVFTFVPDPSEPGSTVFDLGGNITADTGSPFAGDESVVLATDRAVLFSGKIWGGQS
ncbi:MAG TPA: type IV pilin N-terminal domain-containing protein [Methanoregula sp.]|nr:type IV pilin N-terminal domain-containing protein [Methanoregula sp.]